jgi:excisionase family DNA binding protein
MSAPVDRGTIRDARDVLDILADLVAERLSARGVAAAPSSAGALLNVAQVAALLMRHPDTVRSMLRAGKLPGTHVGRSWRVDRHALERHLAGARAADLERQEERRQVEAACERQRARARAGRRGRSLLR